MERGQLPRPKNQHGDQTMKKPFKFQPLIPSRSGSPLQGVGKILADIYESRHKPLIRLPKRYDVKGKPSFVVADVIMSEGQIRDINGEVWQAKQAGGSYVAIA